MFSRAVRCSYTQFKGNAAAGQLLKVSMKEKASESISLPELFSKHHLILSLSVSLVGFVVSFSHSHETKIIYLSGSLPAKVVVMFVLLYVTLFLFL